MSTIHQIWIKDPKTSWTLIQYKSSAPANTALPVGAKQSNAALVKHNSLARLGAHTTYDLVDGTQITVPDFNVALFNASHTIMHDDITSIDDMHEASVLNLVSLRFGVDKVYTNIGQIVVAVNPYRSIPDLYDLPYTSGPHIFAVSKRAYDTLWQEDKNQVIIVNGESGAGKTESTKIMVRHLTYMSNELEAEHERRAGRHFSSSSSPAFSSSSSSSSTTFSEFAHTVGTVDLEVDESDDEINEDEKDTTETKTNAQPTTAAVGKPCKVDDLVLSSNAVCEAFGNAKTIHNNNSSRFGKFLSLFFSPTTKCIDACSVHHFLLEKSRVTHHAQGERSYHSFYQMVHGANRNQRKEWKLKQVKEYKYLAAKETTVSSQTSKRSKRSKGPTTPSLHPTIDPKEDATNFQTTLRSLSDVGFNASEIDHLFRLLSGILLLGNLTFKNGALDNNSNGNSEDDTHEHAELCCTKTDTTLHVELSQLFGLDGTNISMMLSKATTTRVMQARRGSITEIKLSVMDAEASRDGLAKFLYSGIFDHIFNRLNQRGGGSSKGHTISVLDIFGFEIVTTNSFEQLVINYANESLQAVYNEFVFGQEIKQYENEGVDASNITYTDNVELLQLLDMKPMGIFWLLDQQGMRGGKAASDSAFLANVYQAHATDASSSASRIATNSSSNAFFSKPRFGGEAFVVNHFAGDVTYEVEGFIKKNNDALHADLRALLDRCASPLINAIVSADTAASAMPESGAVDATTGNVKKKRASRRPMSTKLTGKRTVGRQIRNEMKSLSSIIHMASPHFVRCIKPNSKMAPAPTFNKALVLQQLRHLGCLETCRIRRQGFPIRRPFKDIVFAYGCLVGIDQLEDSSIVMRDACLSILEQHARVEEPGNNGKDTTKHDDIFRVGNTKAFLRDGVLEILNVAKTKWKNQRLAAAVKIQCKIRQRKAHKKVIALLTIQRRLTAALKLQALLRGNKDRQRATALKRAQALQLKNKAQWDSAIVLQRFARGRRTRNQDLLTKRREERNRAKAVVKVQALMRSKSMQRVYSQKQTSAVKISSFFRKKRSQAKFGVSRKSAIFIQTAVRRFMAMVAYRKKVQDLVENTAATRLQAWYRCCTQSYLYREKNRAIVSIQSTFRSYRTHSRYTLYANIRRPWRHLLAPNEVLLRVSYCVKYAGTGIAKMIGIKRRRLLFLTSAGRVIYTNPFSKKLKPRSKGDFRISLRDNFGVNMVDASLFEFIATTRKYKFMDLFNDSKGWLTMTKSFLVLLHEEHPTLLMDSNTSSNNKKSTEEKKVPPLGLSTIMFSPQIDPLYAYLKQGLLFKSNTKKSILQRNHQRVWDNRWFILHGVNLYWFKADGVGKPRGKVVVNANSRVKISADRDFCFKLITPLFPNGILLAAGSNDGKKMWKSALDKVISSCISKVDRTIRKHHREKSLSGKNTESLAAFRVSYVEEMNTDDLGFDSDGEEEDTFDETGEKNDSNAEERKSQHFRQKTNVNFLAM